MLYIAFIFCSCVYNKKNIYENPQIIKLMLYSYLAKMFLNLTLLFKVSRGQDWSFFYYDVVTGNNTQIKLHHTTLHRRYWQTDGDLMDDDIRCSWQSAIAFCFNNINIKPELYSFAAFLCSVIFWFLVYRISITMESKFATSQCVYQCWNER